MPRNVRAAGTVVARSIGFGALSGAGLGVAGLVVLGVDPGDWDSVAEFLGFTLVGAPFAAVIGAVFGTLVGLFCGAVLVVGGPNVTGDRGSVRGVAGAAAAAPIVALAAWTYAAQPGVPPWELAGWVWWLVVAAMACVTGIAIGPHVVGGQADPLTPGHSCLRHCHLRGRVVPG